MDRPRVDPQQQPQDPFAIKLGAYVFRAAILAAAVLVVVSLLGG